MSIASAPPKSAAIGDQVIKAWQPAPRPEWVARVNAEGRNLDIAAIVPLQPDYLLAAAKRATGLADFGADDWQEPFEILVRSIDEEAELNLVGRIMTSSELLNMLCARLRIEEQYRLHPEIADEMISAPTFILGQPRTGTSALQNLLDRDPENAVVHTWEAWFPAPLDDMDPLDSEKRMARGDVQSTLWNRVAPEFAALHEINGAAPTECNLIHSLAFRSPTMVHLGQIPSYRAWIAQAPMKPAFDYHTRVLKMLQWRSGVARWMLKSPDYIMMVPQIFEQYPDARLVMTHRDPIKAFGSGVSLIGTVQWMRTDHPFKYDAGASHTTALRFIASLLDDLIDRIETGKIAADRICNVGYREFTADPITTVRTIYATFGRNLSETAERNMREYLTENATNRSHHSHVYDTVSLDERDEARRIFRRYQEYFDVPGEI